jgi:hypothetical protein
LARSFVCFELTGAAYAGGVRGARFRSGLEAERRIEIEHVDRSQAQPLAASSHRHRFEGHDRPLTRARLRLSSRACRTTPIARAR